MVYFFYNTSIKLLKFLNNFRDYKTTCRIESQTQTEFLLSDFCLPWHVEYFGWAELQKGRSQQQTQCGDSLNVRYFELYSEKRHFAKCLMHFQ